VSKSLFWLSDEAWLAVAAHLPQNQLGARRVGDRRVISGIVHMLRSGGRWRDCPSEYGAYTTIYNRWNRWSGRRVWGRILGALIAAGRIDERGQLDSSYVKAHRSAGGAIGGGEGAGHRHQPRRTHHQALLRDASTSPSTSTPAATRRNCSKNPVTSSGAQTTGNCGTPAAV
jgi:transposase